LRSGLNHKLARASPGRRAAIRVQLFATVAMVLPDFFVTRIVNQW
jgi:hypothetical protein